MLLSLNWLKDFVKIPGSITPEELAVRLTLHTVEVEAVENQAKKFDRVVVGKILEVKPHPNADRLQLVKVNSGNEVLEIVCGATNIAPGQLVPLALTGAVLPNGVEIREVEVRGVKSNGMLCASDELGLGEDCSGILILNKAAKIGQNLAKHLRLEETVFEIDNKSLTNRPDLWSHLGMAREIAAFLKTRFSPYQPNKKILAKPTGSFKVKVIVEDGQLCPRYMAVGVERVRVAPSPDWLAKRLIASGMRPINNIVDVTNYVMLELGQPLHAFDASRINTNKETNKRESLIIVRKAKEGEFIETLEGEKRKLDKDTLVIADSKKPIAIAGVMGGANGEISDKTTSVIIESANFDFISIRKTSQKLGLRTESSIRFEKSLDPFLAETAIIRAVELILKICPGAKVASDLVDNFTLESRQAKHTILLNLGWLYRRLGEAIKPSRVIEILSSLGFTVKQKDDDLSVAVPSWRAIRDIEIAEDLAEEVVRIYGFDKIKASLPEIVMFQPEKDEERKFEKKIKEFLAGGAALTEVYNYSFVGAEQMKKLFLDYAGHLKLANPIAAHQTMLRQSLAPNLIENVKLNQPRFREIGLFEIGSVFLSSEGELDKDNRGGGKLPFQEKRLGIILAEDEAADLFRKTKGVVEYLLDSFELQGEWKSAEIKFNWADEKQSADLRVAGRTVGSVNKLSSKIGRGLGLKKEAAVAEINLKQLFIAVKVRGPKKYQEYEKYPPLTRDLAFVVNNKILYSDIKEEIEGFSELIRQVELFDVFTGGKLGPKNKNLAFHLIYQAADRTLTAAEVDKLQAELIKKLEEKFGAKIRNF